MFDLALLILMGAVAMLTLCALEWAVNIIITTEAQRAQRQARLRYERILREAVLLSSPISPVLPALPILPEVRDANS